MKDHLIAPTGERISNATFLKWCDQNSVSPMETLSPNQEIEINALAAQDAATLALIAPKASSRTAAAAALEDAALAVVPVELQAEWLVKVEKLRTAWCDSPLTQNVINVGGGRVSGVRSGKMWWDTTAVTPYDGGGSGYGRHAD